MSVDAWHFVGSTLRNGQPVPPDGVWLEYDGPLPIIMCERGLHASVNPFDALQYAPGNTLCRVALDGDILADADKHVATRRIIHARRDMESILRAFARRCALDVINLWGAPPIVREYLETGDESKRGAARGAAGAAAWAAARDAARGAAGAAARDAAWGAARDAAWAAARDSAWAAARDSAWDAARGAAWGAAWDAAWGAAWAAARDSAWDAARGAAREKYRGWFHAMVNEAFAEVPHAR